MSSPPRRSPSARRCGPSSRPMPQHVVDNAKALADSLQGSGPRHRLRRHRHASDARRPAAQEALTGKAAEAALGRANITCNKNGVPFDPEKPTVTSGIRLGTPAGTTRGFGAAEFREIGDMIVGRSRWAGRQWRRRQCGGRGGGPRPRHGADRSLPDLRNGRGPGEPAEATCAALIAAATTPR